HRPPSRPLSHAAAGRLHRRGAADQLARRLARGEPADGSLRRRIPDRHPVGLPLRGRPEPGQHHAQPVRHAAPVPAAARDGSLPLPECPRGAGRRILRRRSVRAAAARLAQRHSLPAQSRRGLRAFVDHRQGPRGRPAERARADMRRFAPALFRLILCLGTAAAAWPAPAQDAIGRLFYTPVQRATLDTARRQRARAALAEDAEQSAPAPQTITYSGVVRRSDGRNTVFLNNRAVPERELNSGAAVVGSVLNDGAIILQAPQSGRVATLKPGQRIELLSGAIEEAYSRSPTAKAGSK